MKRALKPDLNRARLHVPGHWSLRLKLTLGYVAVFAVTVLLGAVLVYFTARGSLTRSLDATLQETASVAGASTLRQGVAARFAPELRAIRDLHIELSCSRRRAGSSPASVRLRARARLRGSAGLRLGGQRCKWVLPASTSSAS